MPPFRIVTNDGLVHATITWPLENGRVILEPFKRLEATTMLALEEESQRLEAFSRD